MNDKDQAVQAVVQLLTRKRSKEITQEEFIASVAKEASKARIPAFRLVKQAETHLDFASLVKPKQILKKVLEQPPLPPELVVDTTPRSPINLSPFAIVKEVVSGEDGKLTFTDLPAGNRFLLISIPENDVRYGAQPDAFVTAEKRRRNFFILADFLPGQTTAPSPSPQSSGPAPVVPVKGGDETDEDLAPPEKEEEDDDK